MITMLKFIYNYILIPIFISVLFVGSLFNNKIRRGFKDRKNLEEKIKKAVVSFDKSKKRIWFHSSSMGEFEQAKPIIEKIKKSQDVYIIVSFFSPSGYANSVNYPYADLVTYIPIDTPKRCRSFLKLININAAVFMRYDIWPNMIFELANQKIPALLVDATLRRNSLRKIGLSKTFHNHIYNSLHKILTVSDDDKKNFLEFNLLEEKVKTVGDTRFDRVHQKSLVAKDRKLIEENLFAGKTVFVMGSSWESDEDVLLPALFRLMKRHQELILIIVPHEPTINHLEKLEHQIKRDLGSIRFSYLNNYKNQRVILIDSIGILLSLYYYADIVFVGGGFKQGVHNVLEPAVYGLPVLFGPKIQNSQESLALIEEGGGRVIYNTRDAYKIIKQLISDKTYREKLGKISSDYVKSHIGATEKIYKEIISVIKLK